MLYVEGNGVGRDAKRAAPGWLLAANKGHYKSQALLGRMLFRGEHGTRQRASGLMWLTIACDGPGAKVPGSRICARQRSSRPATTNARWR